MRLFLIEQKKRVVLLLMMALWLSLFPIWVDWVNKSPLDEAIQLSPRGSISKEIRIVIPESYQLNFVFERADHPFEQLKTLIGFWGSLYGEPIVSGVRVPIKWALTDTEGGRLVASGEVDSFGSMSWSVAEVERNIGHIQVPPGQYLFTAEILRDVPELAHIKTRVVLHFRATASTTWQVTFAWWGSLLNLFIVWPYGIFIALTLLWRAGLTCCAKRRIPK